MATMSERVEGNRSSQSQPCDAGPHPREDFEAQPSAAWWLLERLFNVAQAAQTYYQGYCQDEAADDGMDFTGCSYEQHRDAKALRDALADYSAEETLRAVQQAASRPAENGAADGAERATPGASEAKPWDEPLPSSPLPDLLREVVEALKKIASMSSSRGYRLGDAKQVAQAALSHAQEIMGDPHSEEG
jgi:hypothetical protein